MLLFYYQFLHMSINLDPIFAGTECNVLKVNVVFMEILGYRPRRPPYVVHGTYVLMNTDVANPLNHATLENLSEPRCIAILPSNYTVGRTLHLPIVGSILLRH